MKKNKTKRVLINGSMLDDKPTGVGNYIISVVNELIKIDNDKIEFSLITPKNKFAEKLPLKKIYISPLLKASNKGRLAGLYRLLWNIFIYPIYLRKYDLGYSPTSHGSLFSKNQIITIHDLIAFQHPKQHILQYLYFKLAIPMWLGRVKSIIAISNNTRNDINKYFNKYDDHKIKVIYNGVHLELQEKNNAQEYVKKKFKLENYILTIGAAYPHKNIETLIRAYHNLDNQIKSTYKLVICGSTNNHTKHLISISEQLKLNDFIIFTGYISNEDLNYLYSAANLFVFPSLYEGFGFPPLEAMSCGCPVIVSDIPIFREIYGDAVQYFNKNNFIELSNKIRDTLLDPIRNNNIIAIGSQLIHKYSWNKCGKEILQQIKNTYPNNIN